MTATRESARVETQRERELTAMLVRCRDTMAEAAKHVDGFVEDELWAQVEEVELLLSEHLLDDIRPTARRLGDVQRVAVVADLAMSEGRLP